MVHKLDSKLITIISYAQGPGDHFLLETEFLWLGISKVDVVSEHIIPKGTVRLFEDGRC